MNRSIVFIAIFFLPQITLAQQTFEGFYTQIGIGHQNSKATGNNITSVFSDNPTISFPLEVSSDAITGLTQNIGLGYTRKINNEFHLGIGADFNPYKSQSANFKFYNQILGEVNNSYKKTDIFNFFITPSFSFSANELVYFKLGYSSTILKLKSGSNSISPGQIDNFRLNGYIAGVGYKKFFEQNIYAFTEANYNNYKPALTISNGTNSSNVTNTTTGKTSMKSHSLIVGIGYKF